MTILRTKSKDFYRLLLHKTHTNPHSGPKRWERSISSDKITWKEIFRSIRRTCQENKLRKFHFKFIHRIIVTTKTVIVFTAAKRTLLITVLIIVNLQRLSLRKCCSGLIPLTIPGSILMLEKAIWFPK